MEATSQNSYSYDCALLFEKYGRDDLAKLIYIKALEKDIRDVVAMKRLGVLLFRSKNYHAAFRCFRGVMTLTHNESTHVWLALCELAQGKYELVKKWLPRELSAFSLWIETDEKDLGMYQELLDSCRSLIGGSLVVENH